MQSNWEEAHSSALREYVEKGMSFAEAAAALNARFGTVFTRNAAIGRARRMGMSQPKELLRFVRNPAPKPPDARRLNQLRARHLAQSQTPARREVSERAAALQLRCVALTPRNLALVDLDDGDCRYPYGGDAEGEPITFCGHPRREGVSYCTAHFRLATDIEGERERERRPSERRLRLVEAA